MMEPKFQKNDIVTWLEGLDPRNQTRVLGKITDVEKRHMKATEFTVETTYIYYTVELEDGTIRAYLSGNKFKLVAYDIYVLRGSHISYGPRTKGYMDNWIKVETLKNWDEAIAAFINKITDVHDTLKIRLCLGNECLFETETAEPTPEIPEFMKIEGETPVRVMGTSPLETLFGVGRDFGME